MISTQLDLFGGPPKPPKNIREEEPPIATPPAEEKAVEPVLQPEPEIPEGSSEAPVLDEEKEVLQDELPEWIAEPAPETDIEIDEEPIYEPYQDVIDAPLDEYEPGFEDDLQPEEKSGVDAATHDEPLAEKDDVTASEDEPGEVDTTFTEPTQEVEDGTEPASESEAVYPTLEEPTQEIEDARELLSEPDAIDENEIPLAFEDVQEKGKDAEETLANPIPEDTVHVQLPSFHANPVVFTALIPVEDFVVEEETADDAKETQPEISDKPNEDENEVSLLESDSEDLDLQEEEPLSPPFMVEAVTTSDVIIGGDADIADANAEDTQETKDGQLQIPEDEKLFLRQYYTMRETSTMFGVNQSLLRYWENEFDVLKPKKNRKGDRYFRPEDIKNLELIYHLLKVRKFTIEGAREYIKSKKKVLDTFELVQRLEKLKGFLHELKTHL